MKTWLSKIADELVPLPLGWQWTFMLWATTIAITTLITLVVNNAIKTHTSPFPYKSGGLTAEKLSTQDLQLFLITYDKHEYNVLLDKDNILILMVHSPSCLHKIK